MTTNVSGAMALALMIAGGCASSKTNAEAADPVDPVIAVAPAGARRSNDIITSVELLESGAQNLHQAIQILRPNWLRARPRAVVGAGHAAGAIVIRMAKQ